MVNKNTRAPIPTHLFIDVSSEVCPVPRSLELIADRQIKIPDYIRTGGHRFLSLVAKLPIREEPTLFSLWAGLLTSGSSYSPTFPSMNDSGYSAFVPGHSGGSVTDFHRFPSIPFPGLPMNNYEQYPHGAFKVNNLFLHEATGHRTTENLFD